jgi:deoxyadenosine/deoxycytidine kinase
MGKFIVIVGNTGVGKTTLVRALAATGRFVTGMEGHGERPFHALFKDNPRFALANQIDFLLLRAEQERQLRSSQSVGLQDGGLEQDFHGFTKLFRNKGLLSSDEFALCERLYRHIRSAQPPPEAIIRLTAPLDMIAARFTRRGRPIEIAEREDLCSIEALLDDWLADVEPGRLLRLDVSADDPSCRLILPSVLDFISNIQTIIP